MCCFSLAKDEPSLQRLTNIEEKVVPTRAIIRFSICLCLFLCMTLQASLTHACYRARSENETHILSKFTHMFPKFSPAAALREGSGGPYGRRTSPPARRGRTTASSVWCAARTTRWSSNYTPDAEYVRFDLLLRAAFVADENGDYMLEPARTLLPLRHLWLLWLRHCLRVTFQLGYGQPPQTRVLQASRKAMLTTFSATLGGLVRVSGGPVPGRVLCARSSL